MAAAAAVHWQAAARYKRVGVVLSGGNIDALSFSSSAEMKREVVQRCFYSM